MAFRNSKIQINLSKANHKTFFPPAKAGGNVIFYNGNFSRRNVWLKQFTKHHGFVPATEDVGNARE